MAAATAALQSKATRSFSTIGADWIIASNPTVYKLLQETLGFSTLETIHIAQNDAIPTLVECTRNNPNAVILIHLSTWHEQMKLTLARIRDACPDVPILLLLEHCPIEQSDTIDAVMKQQKTILVRICVKDAILIAADHARLALDQVVVYSLLNRNDD